MVAERAIAPDEEIATERDIAPDDWSTLPDVAWTVRIPVQPTALLDQPPGWHDPNGVDHFIRFIRERIAAWSKEPFTVDPRANQRTHVVSAWPPIWVHGFTLPVALKHFGAAIEDSRAMLELGDDWDGEGSPGYKEKTWSVAVRIVIESAKAFLSTHNDNVPPPPAISKGPDGSVDVLWKSSTRKLMINVPADDDEPVTYHGYDRENASREIKGSLDPVDKNEWILSWLTE